LGKGLARKSATQRATKIAAGGFPVNIHGNPANELRWKIDADKKPAHNSRHASPESMNKKNNPPAKPKSSPSPPAGKYASPQPIAIGAVPEGKIVDFLTGRFFCDTPEEYVRQNIEKALVRQYKYGIIPFA
jgi:hypothetical protein